MVRPIGEFELYCAVKAATGHGDTFFLNAYSATKFVEKVERRDPELVAALRARIILGID